MLFRSVANKKFHIDVKNDTDKYKLVTSKDIIGDDDEKKGVPMFYDNYHIAILPPRTFLSVQNIISKPGIGHRDNIGHSYAMRIGYDYKDNEWTIKTTPITTVAEPKQIVDQTCRLLIRMYANLKRIVTIAKDYKYMDDTYTVSESENVVVYKWKGASLPIGNVITAWGQMIDSSPETWITCNTIHCTITAIEIKVRHQDVKKYMESILDSVIEVYRKIQLAF